MKASYILKVILKKSKPVIWYQVEVPSGITFSVLSLILDIVVGHEGGKFDFASNNAGVQLREGVLEDGSRPDYYLSLQEADTTFIDDYFEEGEWFTYRPDMAHETEYRVEILNKSQTAVIMPLISKTSQEVRKQYDKDPGWLDLRTKKLISLKPDYDGKFSFVKRSALKMPEGTIGERHLLPAAAKPVSKKENIIYSANHYLGEIARQFSEYGKASRSRSGTEDGRSLQKILHAAYDIKDLAFLAKDLGLNVKRIQMETKSTDSMSVVLASKCADCLLQPDVMMQRMLDINDRQMKTFKQAVSEGGTITAETWDQDDDMLTFHEILYAFPLKNERTYIIPTDVMAVFKAIDTPQFEERRRQSIWLKDCLDIVGYYYGSIPVSEFYKIYSQFGTLSREKMAASIRKMNTDETSCILKNERIIDLGWVHDDEYKKLERFHGDKPFYIPGKEEIEDLSWNLYPTRQPEVMAFFRFAKKTFELDEMETEELTEEVWHILNQGGTIHDVIDHIEEFKYTFPSEKAFRQFADIIMNLSNNVHMLYNRGFTPNDLHRLMMKKKGSSSKGLTMVAGSSLAADMLRQSEKELQKRGARVDLDAGADEKTVAGKKKKIYPNDPCPCGSGKKYKKCCGLKK